MTVRNIPGPLRDFLENNPAVAPQQRQYATKLNSVVFDSEDADYTLFTNFDSGWGQAMERAEEETSWEAVRQAPADNAVNKGTDNGFVNAFFSEERQIIRGFMRFDLASMSITTIRNARIVLQVTVGEGHRIALLQCSSSFVVGNFDYMLDFPLLGLGAGPVPASGEYVIDFNYDGLKYLDSVLSDYAYISFLDYNNDFLNVEPAEVSVEPTQIYFATGGQEPKLEIAL